MIDSYKTISRPSPEGLFKDRGSKFFGYAFPIDKESDVSDFIDQIRSQHHKARHFCFAWRIGDYFRVNDDGEPSNSAGQPIYGQMLSFDVDRVLVVVVRYFGGTKLGVGGLVNAYKNAAKEALSESIVVEKTIDERILITFEYPQMNRVLRIIKDAGAEILDRKMELKCEFKVALRFSAVAQFLEKITDQNLAEATKVD